MNYKLLVIFIIVYLILDLSWIQIFSHKINPLIESIQNQKLKINMIGTILAYIVIIFAYYNIAFTEDSVNKVVNFNYKNAMILGLAMYGTYEFTNYATISKWNDPIVMGMDIGWGILVSFLGVYITSIIYNKLII